MKKRIFLSLISASVLLANTTAKNTNNAVNNYYIHIKNHLNKDFNINSNSEGAIQSNNKQKIDHFIDTTIYTDILQNSYKKSNIVNAVKTNYLANNIAYQQKLMNEKREINYKTKNKNLLINVRGYCRVLNTIKVFASDQFGEVSCNLENIKTHKTLNANVFVKFMPDYKREMLIAFPVYANLDSKRVNATGYFLNATKTSLNIADKIDGVRIKKLLLKGLLVESDIAYKQAMLYINALQASNTTTSVSYITNGNNQTIPVQSSQTKKPDVRTYINTGIVQSIAMLIKMMGEDSLYKLKPLFYVHKGDIFYTEMILKEDKNIFGKMQQIMNNKEQQINKNNNIYQKNLINFAGQK